MPIGMLPALCQGMQTQITVSRAVARKGLAVFANDKLVRRVTDSHHGVLEAMAMAGMGPHFAEQIAASMLARKVELCPAPAV